MSKYKVGDIVKLRDDLEDGKKYGTVSYAREMDFIKGKPMELIAKSNALKNCYITKDEEYAEWYLSDEMIQGLWEECKGIAYEPYEEKTNKYKLIDILNKIANGELKEGTKVIYKGDKYKCIDGVLADEKGNELFYYITENNNLNEEVELIEPNGFADVGKMIEHLPDGSKVLEPTDNTKIKELTQLARGLSNDKEKINIMWDKLNEVIRVLNK